MTNDAKSNLGIALIIFLIIAFTLFWGRFCTGATLSAPITWTTDAELCQKCDSVTAIFDTLIQESGFVSPRLDSLGNYYTFYYMDTLLVPRRIIGVLDKGVVSIDSAWQDSFGIWGKEHYEYHNGIILYEGEK
jgi:hypothetical protein